jgi:hypothetical protein
VANKLDLYYKRLWDNEDHSKVTVQDATDCTIESVWDFEENAEYVVNDLAKYIYDECDGAHYMPDTELKIRVWDENRKLIGDFTIDTEFDPVFYVNECEEKVT